MNPCEIPCNTCPVWSSDDTVRKIVGQILPEALKRKPPTHNALAVFAGATLGISGIATYEQLNNLGVSAPEAIASAAEQIAQNKCQNNPL